MNKTILTRHPSLPYLFHFRVEEDIVEELHVYPEAADSILGNIFVGKVQNVVKSIGAAFVLIDSERMGYLPLDDCIHPIYVKKGSSPSIQQGDELLIQITREAIATKEYSVSTNLQLSGKFCILTSQDRKIGVSSKLSKTVRATLREWMNEHRKSEYGYILRTCSATVEPNIRLEEIHTLEEEMDQLIQLAPYKTPFTCVKQQPAIWIRSILNSNPEITGPILTDQTDLHEQLHSYLRQSSTNSFEQSLYTDSYSLWNLYSFEKVVRQALKKKVWLSCGGYLIIEKTEAMWVIDVNSGKSIQGKQKEKNALKVNLEAAKEIAHQMILRNMSGICMIDFINMTETESMNQLVSTVQKLLSTDPVGASFIDLTKLQIMEVTRTKKERPLYEILEKDIAFFGKTIDETNVIC